MIDQLNKWLEGQGETVNKTELQAFLLTLKQTTNYSDLKKELSDKLNELYGKKQIIGFGDVYFIPTDKELESHIKRFLREYPQANDMAKIKKILFNHIETCVKNRNFAPAIKYFIHKQGFGSRLAAAYESFEELENDNDDITNEVSL